MEVKHSSWTSVAVIALVLGSGAAPGAEIVVSTDRNQKSASHASTADVADRQRSTFTPRFVSPTTASTVATDRADGSALRKPASVYFVTPASRTPAAAEPMAVAADDAATRSPVDSPDLRFSDPSPQGVFQAAHFESIAADDEPPIPVASDDGAPPAEVPARNTASSLRVTDVEPTPPRQDPLPAPATSPPLPIDASEIDQMVKRPLVDPADQMLIEAHQIALSADDASQYSQIARLCTDALNECSDSHARTFGAKLGGWAFNRRGQLRMDDGDTDLALADFNAAIELDGESWRPYHNRSVIFARTGQFAEAFDDVSAVIERNPGFAKAFSNRATLYVQAGEHELAVADYVEALRINPDLETALVGYGRVCHMLGRLPEALQQLNSAIELNSDDPEIFCSRADLYADMGNYAAALADYARAIEIDPEFAHAFRNGSWLLSTCPDERYRDVENALFGARQVLEYDYGEKHAALDTLAAALANAGKFDMAVEVMTEACQLAPEPMIEAYQLRLELYQARRPYRTQPIE